MTVFVDAKKNTSVRKVKKMIMARRTSYPSGGTCPAPTGKRKKEDVDVFLMVKRKKLPTSWTLRSMCRCAS